ncbi:MAG: GNAT family N-acetyltransferase [Myxococcota bacterium]|nr:GNAT family N-acetyltransferase [Myxococcota bacterium]
MVGQSVDVVFVEFTPEHELELLRLWRASFHQAVGVEEDTRAEAFDEHLEFLRSLDPAFIRVAWDASGNRIAGFMRKEGSHICDLFIHTECQRMGLGSRFIRQAKDEEAFLSLNTFELNQGARRFYEAHGFVVAGRGFASAEDNPWSTSQEQRADIQYEWRCP